MKYQTNSILKRGSTEFLAVVLILTGLLPLAGVAGRLPPNAAAMTIPESSALTLAQVVETTYQRNPTLQVLEARLQEAAAVRRQAQALLAGDPALQVRHNTGQVGTPDGLREWEWGIELPLWLPGQRGAQREVANERYQAVTASEKALRLAIAGKIRNLLWTIRANQNQASLAEKAFRISQDLQHDVGRRVETGELARLDVVLARQETLDRRAAYLKAHANLRQNYNRYRILTGLDQIPVEFSEQQVATLIVDKEHPAIADAMATVAEEKAMRDRTLTERRANPTLLIGTRHERPDNGVDFENTLGVTINVPFGLSVFLASKAAAAETSLANARTKRDLLKRQLDVELQQAKDALVAARETLDIAKQQANLAQENLSLIRRSFELGETNLFHFLQVQRRAFTAERNLRQSKIDLQAGMAKYNQAVGILP